MVEMAIGKYPIPPPSATELIEIFGINALQDHLEAAKSGKPLPGISLTQSYQLANI